MADEQLLDEEFMRKIEQLDIVSKKIFAGKFRGERRSKRKGVSVEFADYRSYSQGDDLRFVDWNIYGRLDRLFLKLFLEEEDLHVYVMIDSSASMSFGSPSKFFYAKRICAALSYIALANFNRVALGTFSENLEGALPATRGKNQISRVLSFLNDLECEGGTSLSTSCKSFALKQQKRGIIILISDFFDKAGYEKAFKFFLSRKLDVFAVQILSDEEVNPELVGDLKLIDIEDGDETEITISSPLMKAYKRNLNLFCGSLKSYCSSRDISYLFATTSLPFDRLILSYLRERGLLK